MLTKTEAIVLRTVKYGDQTLIADLFTREYGRLSFAVRVSSSAKAKVKRQLFQPSALINVEFDYRQRIGVQKVRGVSTSRPYLTIPTNPYKLTLAIFLTEFLCYATRSEQRNVLLFDYIRAGMEWLDGCTGSFANFHIVFMLRLSHLLGFYPNVETHHDSRFFDLRSGCFVAECPSHLDFLKPDEASKIALIMRMDYPTMHLFAMSHEERNRCLDIILRFYRLHIPGFPELKSLEVLRELFRN